MVASGCPGRGRRQPGSGNGSSGGGEGSPPFPAPPGAGSWDMALAMLPALSACPAQRLQHIARARNRSSLPWPQEGVWACACSTTLQHAICVVGWAAGAQGGLGPALSVPGLLGSRQKSEFMAPLCNRSSCKRCAAAIACLVHSRCRPQEAPSTLVLLPQLPLLAGCPGECAAPAGDSRREPCSLAESRAPPPTTTKPAARRPPTPSLLRSLSQQCRRPP